MKKILIIVLLLLLIVLQYQLWFAPGGLGKTLRLQRKVQAQRELNDELKKQNDALTAGVNNLKQGTAAVEQVARHDLGMIKKGEVFYRLVKNKEK